jgi:LPXTG-motif cell wall-anchored protein
VKKQFLDSIGGRVAGMGALALGFWLLYKAFLDDNILFGIGGALLILAGMWFFTRGRRMTDGPKP